jgi:UDP-glucose 4-epimerase
MKNILVTGGAGHVGSSLVERLLKEDEYRVTVVDDLSTGRRRKMSFLGHERCNFIKADVNERQDIQEVMLSRQFDAVFHLAAVVGVQRTQEDPCSVLLDIEGIRNILDLCKNTGVKRYLYSSSSEVYGEPVETPQHEQHTPLNSRVPYAVVKNVGESFARSYHQEFGLDFTIFRLFNTYGPRQSEDFVISHFVAGALRGDDITIYGDGSQSRTFCYVDDTVDTIVATLREEACLNDVINIGASVEVSVLELAQRIIKITNSNSKIVHLPPLPDGDMTRRQPDNSKMLKLLKRDLIPLDDGIQRLLNDQIFMDLCVPKD